MSIANFIIDLKSMGVSKLLGLSAAVAINSSVIINTEFSSPEIEIKLEQNFQECLLSSNCQKSLSENSSTDFELIQDFQDKNNKSFNYTYEDNEKLLEYLSSDKILKLNPIQLSKSGNYISERNSIAASSEKGQRSLQRSPASVGSSSEGSVQGARSAREDLKPQELPKAQKGQGQAQKSQIASVQSETKVSILNSKTLNPKGLEVKESISNSSEVKGTGFKKEGNGVNSIIAGGVSNKSSSSQNSSKSLKTSSTVTQINGSSQASNNSAKSSQVIVGSLNSDINYCNSSLDSSDTACLIYTNDNQVSYTGGAGDEIIGNSTSTTNQFSAYIVFKSNRLHQAGDSAAADILLNLDGSNNLQINYSDSNPYSHTIFFAGNKIGKTNNVDSNIGKGAGLTETGVSYEGKFNSTHIIHLSWEKGAKVAISLDGNLIDSQDAHNGNLNIRNLILAQGFSGDLSEVIFVNKSTLDSSGNLEQITKDNIDALKSKWSIP